MSQIPDPVITPEGIKRHLDSIDKRLSALESDPVIDGWADIARALSAAYSTARRWAEEERDPLPVVIDHKNHPTIRSSSLRDWAERRSLPCSVVREIRRLQSELADAKRRLAVHEAAQASKAPVSDPA